MLAALTFWRKFDDRFNISKIYLFLVLCTITLANFIPASQAYYYDVSRYGPKDDMYRVVRAPAAKWMRFGKREPNAAKWMRFGKRSDEGGGAALKDNINSIDNEIRSQQLLWSK